ncbi:MAG: hypothetical protein HY828_22140 [Actinobacteria bacterium]|nr:hypothetical protein [Actinomycetota bacterium]
MTAADPPDQDGQSSPLDAAALLSSVSARVERLRGALAAAGMTEAGLTAAVQALVEAGHQQAARAMTVTGLPVPVGAPAPRGSARFLARADSFLAAVEVALPLVTARETGYHLQMTLIHHGGHVEFIGSGSVHTLAQLRYLEDDFFTYWNEAPDSQTRAFWGQVQAEGLPYQRVDHLRLILTRGRIASRTEYEFAVDSVVVAGQDGRLTQADASLLAPLIGAYEQRRRPR